MLYAKQKIPGALAGAVLLGAMLLPAHAQHYVETQHIDMRTQQTVDTGHIDMRTGTIRGTDVQVQNRRRDTVTNIVVPTAVGAVIGAGTGAIFGNVSVLEGAAIGAGTGAVFGAAETFLPEDSAVEPIAKGAAIGAGTGLVFDEFLTGALIGAGAGGVYYIVRQSGWFGRDRCYDVYGNRVTCP